MKNIFKKFYTLNIFIIIFIAILSFSNFSVKADEKNYYEFNDCGYYVEKTVDTKNLGYGITYQRDFSQLATFDANKITGNAAGLGGGGKAEIGKFYSQQVNKLEISSTEHAKIVPYAILEGSLWNTSTVRNAAEDYESKHPGWKVVAAINGDFFRINDFCKASTGVTISDGEYYKSINNHGNEYSTLAFRNSGTGKQLFQTNKLTTQPVLTIYDNNGEIIKKIAINVVNEEPKENEIALFYNTRVENFKQDMNQITVTDAYFVEKAEVAVTSVKNSFYGKGEISDVVSKVTLKAGQFAIKSNNNEITNLLKTGVLIRAQYEFTDPSLDGIENFIGFPFQLIDNGVGLSHDNYRHPRTMIGQKEDGTIVMTVIDGRQVSQKMYGATASEMSALMSYYGCVDAWNLDGGGSSTMLIRKQGDWVISSAYKDKFDCPWYVTNSPSDASERSDGNCILIVTEAPEATITVEDIMPDTVTLNVALLTMLEKYKDLYVIVNGETKQIVNGKVIIDNLQPHSNYIAHIYAKVDGQMFNLMIEHSFNTAYLKPTDLTMALRTDKKNGVDIYVLNLNILNNESIKRITVKIGNKTYNTISQSIALPIDYETLRDLKNFEFNILFDLDDGNKNQQITLKPIKIKTSPSFILEEQENLINEIINNMLY